MKYSIAEPIGWPWSNRRSALKGGQFAPARDQTNEHPHARSTWPTIARALALGMAEQSLGQAGEERVWGDLGPQADCPVGEVVQSGGPGAVTSEVEGDQAVQAGVVGHVIGREIIVGRDRSSPSDWAGPVLAEQCPLVGSLACFAVPEAHAVAGREEECRAILVIEESTKAGLG